MKRLFTVVLGLLCLNLSYAQNCVDESIMDQSAGCAAIFDPVCGCDGETYPNECIAQLHNGITEFTQGACGENTEPNPPDVPPEENNCDSISALFTYERVSVGISYSSSLPEIIEYYCFYNASEGDIAFYEWDFSTQDTSTEESPCDIPLQMVSGGELSNGYEVCLQVYDSNNCYETYCEIIQAQEDYSEIDGVEGIADGSTDGTTDEGNENSEGTSDGSSDDGTDPEVADEAFADDSGTDLPTDTNTDPASQTGDSAESSGDCEFFTTEFCTAQQTPVIICPEMCEGYYIDFAYTTYNCSLQFLPNDCIQYTPLPAMPPADSLIVTFCQVGGINCIDAIAQVNIGDCETDPEPEPEPESETCEVSYFPQDYCTEPQTSVEICPVICSDYFIFDVTTTYNCSVQDLGDCLRYTPLPGLEQFYEMDTVVVTICQEGLIDCHDITANIYLGCDTNEPPCTENYFDEDYCTEPQTPVEICPVLCTGYYVESVSTTYECSVEIQDNNCIRYTPLPGLEQFYEMDTVLVNVCQIGTQNCQLIAANVYLGCDDTEPCEPGFSEDDYCTEPQTSVTICPDLCDGYSITDVTTTYDCSIQIEENCFQYTPLPGLENFYDSDQLTITICNADGCIDLFTSVNLTCDNTDFGTDTGTDGTTDDNTDDSGNTCDIPDMNECAQIVMPTLICPNMCEGFGIVEVIPTFPCNINIIEDDQCFVYTPLPTAVIGSVDEVKYIICAANSNVCYEFIAFIEVSEDCSVTDDSTDGMTDDGSTDVNTDSGSDGTTDDTTTDSNSDDSTDGTTDDTITDSNSDDSTDGTTDDATTDSNSDDSTDGTTDDTTTDSNSDDSTDGTTDDTITDSNSDDSTDGTTDDATTDSNSDDSTDGTTDDATTDSNSDDSTDGTTDDATTDSNSDDSTDGTTDDSNTDSSAEPCTINPMVTCTGIMEEVTVCPELCEGYNITELTSILPCGMEVTEGGMCFTYLPIAGFTYGVDLVTYTYCTENGEQCYEATVNIEINQDCASGSDNTGTDGMTDDSGTDGNTDDTGSDGTTDNNTDDSADDCDIMEMSACTGIGIPLTICPDLCVNHFIAEVTPSFPCNIQIVNENQCFVYTPLPDAELNAVDMVTYTVCLAGGLDCESYIINIEVSTNCYGSDDSTDGASDDSADDSTSDESGTDSTSTDDSGTDNSSADETGTDEAGTDESVTDDSGTDGNSDSNSDETGTDSNSDSSTDDSGTDSNSNCNSLNETYCTELITPLDICLDLCDGYFVESVLTTYFCSIQILDDNCFRYSPLPGYFGNDNVVVTICDEAMLDCFLMEVPVQVGECNSTDGNADDGVTDDSMSDTSNTDDTTDSGTDDSNGEGTTDANTDDSNSDGTTDANTDDSNSDGTADANTDDSNSDGTSDANTDDSNADCDILEMSACTGVGIPLTICPDICDNHFIAEVTPSFPCNIQIVNENQCFVYTPLPDAQLNAVDEVVYTICLAGGLNCESYIINIEVNNNCYGTDDSTDGTADDSTDDSTSDETGTDGTTDDTSTDGVSDDGTSDGNTDDGSSEPCDLNPMTDCTGIDEAILLCPQLCDGFTISEAMSLLPSSIQVVEGGLCILYTPDFTVGVDQINYEVCDENGMNCSDSTINVEVNEGCSGNTDSTSTDGTTDESTDDISLTDDSGTDANTDDATDSTGTDGTTDDSTDDISLTDDSGTDANTDDTTDGTGNDGTTDSNTDDSSGSVCNTFEDVLCTDLMTTVDFCINLCDGFTIENAVTTYHCSVQIIDENCIRYTPLPGYFGTDTIQVTACNSVIDECAIILVDIQVGECDTFDETGTDGTSDDSTDDISFTDDSGTDSNTDNGTDGTTDDNTDDSGADDNTDTGTDGTTDDSTDDISFTDDSGTDSNTDDAGVDGGGNNGDCNTFDEVLCTDLMTPINFCIDLCEDYEIEKAVTTYHCSVQILEEECIRYTPLPGYNGTDTVQVTICNTMLDECTIVLVDIQVGECDTFDDSSSDGTTDDSTDDISFTDDSGADAGTDDTTDGTSTDGTADDSTDDISFTDDSGTDSGTDECSVAMGFYCTAPYTSIQVCPDLCDNFYISEITTVLPCDVYISDDFQCYTYAPLPEFTSGFDELTITICQAGGINCFTASASVEVNEACGIPPAGNNDPIANPDNYVIDCGSVTISPLDNDSDPDGDPIAICNVGQAQNGMVFIQGTELMYIPDSDFVGTDVITYEICDGFDGSNTASIFIDVQGGASSIEITNDYYAQEGTEDFVIAPLDNDSSASSSLTLCSVGEADFGTVLIENNQLVVNLDKFFSGFATLEYEVCNEDGCGQASGLIYIVVEEPCVEYTEVYCTDYATPITICPEYCGFESGGEYTLDVDMTCDLIPVGDHCFEYIPYPDVIDTVVYLTVDGCDSEGNCQTQEIEVYVGAGAMGMEESTPSCIMEKIAERLSEPPYNPRAAVYVGEYNGEMVYYFSANCCDFFSELYNSECELICHPDGGFGGQGDGNCTDFSIDNFEMIWQDTRM